MSLRFSKSRRKDIDNYLKFFWGGSPQGEFLIERGFLDEEELKSIKAAKDRSEAPDVVKKLIAERCKNLGESYEEKIGRILDLWDGRSRSIVKALETFFDSAWDFGEVTVYFTTTPICTYNFAKGDRHFLVYLFSKPEAQLKTIVHELMHFFFIKNYWSILERRGLNKQQIDMVKEALTVYLNRPPFSKVLVFKDKGHPREKELRDYLTEKHPDPKNVKELLPSVKVYFEGRVIPPTC